MIKDIEAKAKEEADKRIEEISKVLDIFEEQDILGNVKEVGAYLSEKLEMLTEKYEFVQTHRGVGLLQGLVLDKPVGDIIKMALSEGLVLINAGANIIRFVPPLVVTKQDVDQMIAILDKCLGACN